MKIVPEWARTVGAMRDRGKPGDVRSYCPRCRAEGAVDPAAFALMRGDRFSLVNHREPCTLTPGCGGRMKFRIRRSVYLPLWSW